MIDEKINNSLKELEQSLKNLEAARKQVEKTVNAYDGLKATTTEYVNKLSVVTTKVQELVGTIENDYSQKVKVFEKDRETIINASKIATNSLFKATDEFKDSLLEIQMRLKYSLVISTVSLTTIGIIIFLLLK